jgi:hypothetical protein
MNIPDHIFESLETIFWVTKILKSEIFLTLGQQSGMEKFGSGINIPDPQHCYERLSSYRRSLLSRKKKQHFET